MIESYNDIQTWKFKDLVATFGADPKKSKTFQIKTKQEAHDLFNDKEFSSAPYLQVSLQALISIAPNVLILVQFVELYMPKEDAPMALKLTAEASAKTNAKQ